MEGALLLPCYTFVTLCKAGLSGGATPALVVEVLQLVVNLTELQEHLLGSLKLCKVEQHCFELLLAADQHAAFRAAGFVGHPLSEALDHPRRMALFLLAIGTRCNIVVAFLKGWFSESGVPPAMDLLGVIRPTSLPPVAETARFEQQQLHQSLVVTP